MEDLLRKHASYVSKMRPEVSKAKTVDQFCFFCSLLYCTSLAQVIPLALLACRASILEKSEGGWGNRAFSLVNAFLTAVLNGRPLVWIFCFVGTSVLI